MSYFTSDQATKNETKEEESLRRKLNIFGKYDAGN